MTKPLFEEQLPSFDTFAAENIVPTVDANIAMQKEWLDARLTKIDSGDAPTWENFVLPWQAKQDALDRYWSLVSHMNAVHNTEAIREPYAQAQGKISAWSTELGQNKDLYLVYEKLDEQELNAEQKRAVFLALRGFRLSGIDLPESEQERLAELKQELTALTTQYANNVLDCSQAWFYFTTDADELSGIPDSHIAAAQNAAAKSENPEHRSDGYLFTLDIPVYLAVLTHAENRELRKTFYDAYASRASLAGPHDARYNNQELITNILDKRHRIAALLKYPNYAELSFARKMADSPNQVVDFLEDLLQKSRSTAEADVQALQQYAKKTLGYELAAWDFSFVAEKLKQEKYELSEQALREYFPHRKVLNGLFELLYRLYDVSLAADDAIQTSCENAVFYRIKKQGKTIAGLYLDLFAREGKRGGAWMSECLNRQTDAENRLQLPVAYVCCNFAAPMETTDSYLSHNEVTTLFHEFGHALHHTLTEKSVPDVSGINGVAWDAVELPSQFMENFCFEPDVLQLISEHKSKKISLPESMLNKLLAAKNFLSGYQMLRQIEFALFDLQIHSRDASLTADEVAETLSQVREKTSLLPVPESNKFQNAFTHIFAGGYAAGYYSYKWAEVLSADAYESFEQEGVFNKDTAQRFLQTVLSQGGADEAMVLFENFKGRKPSVDALVRHSGIAA